MKRPHRFHTALPMMILAALATAHGQDINSSPMTGGVQDFIEFTQVIPKMDTLLGNVFKIMTYMDVPGVADTVARIIGGIIALLSFGIASFNYGFNRRVNFMGIDGSFNNMLLATITVLFISTGVPRIIGEAGWAVWRVTYTNVESRVHPVMDKIIQERTEALAKQVWNYAVNGLSAGAQPMVTAAMYLKGDLDVTQDGLAGAPYREAAAKDIDKAQAKNEQFSGIWQLGSLLIAGMFMAYIGVIFGSGLFVIFAGVFMPVAFAFIPINSNLIMKQIGGVVSSTLVAGVAPGLMMANVMLVFDGVLQYLTTMMKNQSIAAGDNANFTQDMIQTCLSKTTEGNAAQKVVAGVVDSVNPLGDVMDKFCVINLAGVQTIYTMGQAAIMIIVGLGVAAMLFIGLSGLSMMIFREFKGRVDDIFASGGTLGNGASGAATRAVSAMGNRMLGAAMGAAGVMTGNTQLASAGARSVVSGNNALSGAAASLVERGRDNVLERGRDAKAAASREEGRRERQQETAERERAADEKYAERQKESRAYAENLYEERQKGRQGQGGGQQPESGEGSRTDPRTDGSAGAYAGQPDGGAVQENPTETRSTVPGGAPAAGEADVRSSDANSTPSTQASGGTSTGPSAQSDPRAENSAMPSGRPAPASQASTAAAPISSRAPASDTSSAQASDATLTPDEPAPQGNTEDHATPSPQTGAQGATTSDHGNATQERPSAPVTPPPASPAPASPPPPAASPTPTPASSASANPAAYTSEGNATLRRNGVSAEERDDAAVLDYHKMLNAPAADGSAQGYISRDQARWDLQRRGYLPSQRDENEQLVQAYAQQHGVSDRVAETTLRDARQLVQHREATPVKPPSYPNEAAERAAQQGQQGTQDR